MSSAPLTSAGDPKNTGKNNKVPKQYLLFLLATVFIASLLTIVNHYNILIISNTILLISRLITIAAIVGYAMYKKSLTTWILISMILGAEFGHDLPQIAVKMQVVSMISCA